MSGVGHVAERSPGSWVSVSVFWLVQVSELLVFVVPFAWPLVVSPRPDGYFTHALVNVPPTADAHLAIQTWGSPLWQRSDPDSASDLPDLPYLPVAEVLGDTYGLMIYQESLLRVAQKFAGFTLAEADLPQSSACVWP